MVRKIAFFAFRDDPLIFRHVLMNAVRMYDEGGFETKVVIEGTATSLLKGFVDSKDPDFKLYQMAKNLGLIDCVCRTCSANFGGLNAAKEAGLRVCDEMSGHPSVARYLQQGFEIVVV